ncbi:MAG: MFS transporter [Gammaproteobacteria bacterium]|nr:MFS transporter [Gammaproteobacteria bacterium]
MNLILSESRRLRFFSFTMLYLAQGFPFGLVNTALPAYLAERGESGVAIASFIAIANLPWSFKLLAGPFMDRWTYLAMGRRRPWVIFAQSCMVLTGIAFAFFPGGLENVALLSMLCFTLNVFAASQDVAVDGMAIDVLPPEEHGRANAFMAFGQVAGISISTAVSAFVVINFGMSGIAALLVIAFGLILSVAVSVRERPGEKIMPWGSGEASQRSLDMKPDSWKAIALNLGRVMFLPASLFIFGTAFIFRFAYGVWISLVPIVIVQDLGFESTQYSSFISAVGFIAAMTGLALGLVIDRKGVKVFYAFVLGFYGVLCIFIGLMESAWVSPRFLITIGIIQAFIYQGGFISFIASCMKLCWQKVSATQFAIYMAGANIGLSLGAGTYAALANSLTPSQMFIGLGLVFFVGVGMVWMADFGTHDTRVNLLDNPGRTGDFAPHS